jgi:hypothetical protein
VGFLKFSIATDDSAHTKHPQHPSHANKLQLSHKPSLLCVMSGMSTQFGKLLGHPVLRDPNEYAFTEITTFEFAQPVDLGNEATPVGQIWAKMIQTYSTQESVKMLWWGRRVEVPEVELPQVIKLIIGERFPRPHLTAQY